MHKEEEFVQIIKDHEGVIYKITTFYVDNQEDRNDLYQEIVYQLWKSYSKFNNRSSVGTWLYRIGLNTAITQLRKSKRKIDQIALNQDLFNLTDQKDTVFEERLKLLYAQVSMLNDMEKGIILLFLEKKSHEEIANITGLSVSNVGTRLSRIREKLKKGVLTNLNQ